MPLVDQFILEWNLFQYNLDISPPVVDCHGEPHTWILQPGVAGPQLIAQIVYISLGGAMNECNIVELAY